MRELGLKSDLPAERPTTEGLIATLPLLDLRGRKVGVQPYPGAPEARFTGFSAGCGGRTRHSLARGFDVAITPEHSYFMKPLVTAIVAALSR